MNKSHVQDETTRALVSLFCNYVFRLKQVRYIYRELFEAEDAQALTAGTADTFFFDLNNIMADYWLLEVAKLTDPATSNRVTCENFTIANLIDTVEWSQECLQEIARLNDTVLSFRKYIEPARNKLLAHYDKVTVVSGISLGSFPEGEDEKVLEALEQMCSVLHVASFGEIVGDMVPYHLGDVQDLKKALKRAIAFDKLFSNSKGEDLIRLSRLIKEVGTSP
jgi:hypothetical protein